MSCQIPEPYLGFKPFGALAKQAILDLIDGTDDYLEREDRIQSALDVGVLTYPEAYALRCGEEL